jgi:serine/threonine protein phosphatase PrpC
VDDATLSTVMREGGPVEAIADRLVRTALAKGTRDNVTALVVRYEAGA